MNTKEIKIQVPEGYEIDKENSTFECIKFKPVKRDITYNDICYSLFEDKNSFFITTSGNITDDTLAWAGAIEKNNATNKDQLERLLALNQLFNIAKYYNKLNPLTPLNSKRYIISYNIIFRGYKVSVASAWCKNNLTGIEVLFNDAKDAQAVINNPNFREILDTIYKN